MKIPNGCKSSLEDQLHQVWKVSGNKPEQLCIPEFPKELNYLWNWFCELTRGADQLSYSEIQAWSNLTRTDIEPSEVALIQELNRLRLETFRND